MRSLRELVVGDNQLREVSALLGRLPLSEVSFLSLQYNPLRDGAALEQALQQGITCTTLTYIRTLRYDHIRTKFAAREGSRFSSRLPKVPQNIFSQIRSHIYPTSKHVACTRARTCTYTRKIGVCTTCTLSMYISHTCFCFLLTSFIFHSSFSFTERMIARSAMAAKIQRVWRSYRVRILFRNIVRRILALAAQRKLRK